MNSLKKTYNTSGLEMSSVGGADKYFRVRETPGG